MSPGRRGSFSSVGRRLQNLDRRIFARQIFDGDRGPSRGDEVSDRPETWTHHSSDLSLARPRVWGLLEPVRNRRIFRPDRRIFKNGRVAPGSVGFFAHGPPSDLRRRNVAPPPLPPFLLLPPSSLLLPSPSPLSLARAGRPLRGRKKIFGASDVVRGVGPGPGTVGQGLSDGRRGNPTAGSPPDVVLGPWKGASDLYNGRAAPGSATWSEASDFPKRGNCRPVRFRGASDLYNGRVAPESTVGCAGRAVRSRRGPGGRREGRGRGSGSRGIESQKVEGVLL